MPLPKVSSAKTLRLCDSVVGVSAFIHNLSDHFLATRAANANSRQAELLGIPLGQALLFITRVGYLDDGRAVEITHTWCRSDYYDFVAELRR